MRFIDSELRNAARNVTSWALHTPKVLWIARLGTFKMSNNTFRNSKKDIL